MSSAASDVFFVDDQCLANRPTNRYCVVVADDAIADVDILAVAFENQVWVCRVVLCSVDITLL